MDKIDTIFSILHPRAANLGVYPNYKKDLTGLPEDDQYEAVLAGVDLDNRQLRRELAVAMGAKALGRRLEVEEALQYGAEFRPGRSYRRMVSGIETYETALNPPGNLIVRTALADAGISVNVPPQHVPYYLGTMLGEVRNGKHPEGNHRNGFRNYFDRRVFRERTLGIAASGNAADPYAIYGALTIGQEWQEFGAAPWYGDVAFHLDVDRIADRTTVLPSDSFFPLGNLQRGLPWKQRALFEGLVDEEERLVRLNEDQVAMYAEAQVHGGLSPGDIARVTIPSSVGPRATRKIVRELDDRAIPHEITGNVDEASKMFKRYRYRGVMEPVISG